MSLPSDHLLPLAQVRHIAKLARLRLSDPELEQYQRQLTSILQAITKLQELDVADVEPMAHPSDVTIRLADDQIASSLSLEEVSRNAPAVEDRFLAVPKILADAEEG